MPKEPKDFTAAINKWVGSNLIVKKVFNSHGDTAMFLIKNDRTDPKKPTYEVIRAFTIGADIQVCVDHKNLTAEELAVELFDIPANLK